MQQICISQSLSYSTGVGTGSSTPTTELRQSNTQLNKIRGHSVEILRLLNDCGGLSVIEIADRLDKTPRYISNYLYRLRKYGLIDLNKNNWKWYITALEDIIIYIIYKDNRTTTQQQRKSNKKETVSFFCKNEETDTKGKKQEREQTVSYDFTSSMERDGIKGTHKDVVGVFASRVKQGFKPWVIGRGGEDLCQKLGFLEEHGGLIRYKITPEELESIISDLHEKNWIYKYCLPGSGGLHRVGLYEDRLKDARC